MPHRRQTFPRRVSPSARAFAATAQPWMKGIIAEYGGNPWQRLVDMAHVAQRQGVIKGILLHQGESNTNDAAWPDKVAKIYRNLLTDLRLDAARVPLLAGEVVPPDGVQLSSGKSRSAQRLQAFT